MENLLRQWNLENLIQYFTDLNIDYESLKYLRQRHIDELFTRNQFGIKVKFEHFLYQWQKNMGTYFDTECSCKNQHSTSIIGINQIESNPLTVSTDLTEKAESTNEFNILQTLQKSAEGKTLLNFYNENKKLIPKNRRTLTHIIVEYFIQNDIYLNVDKCRFLAMEIVKLFPSELQSTYFVGRGRRPPRGKLYDRYQNRRKQIKKMCQVSNDSEESSDSKYLSEQQFTPVENVLKEEVFYCN